MGEDRKLYIPPCSIGEKKRIKFILYINTGKTERKNKKGNRSERDVDMKRKVYKTLFLFQKKKTCAKRKTLFLYSSFLFQRKVVGKAFLSKKSLC